MNGGVDCVTCQPGLILYVYNIVITYFSMLFKQLFIIIIIHFTIKDRIEKASKLRSLVFYSRGDLCSSLEMSHHRQ